MRHFEHFSLTEEEWTHVKSLFKKFYKNEAECSGLCPMTYDMGEDEDDTKIGIQIASKVGYIYGAECICHALKIMDEAGCPCSILGQKAFVKLEELITKWQREGEI